MNLHRKLGKLLNWHTHRKRTDMTPPANSTLLGLRVILLYITGTATSVQLDAAFAKGWISVADYYAATGENPPGFGG